MMDYSKPKGISVNYFRSMIGMMLLVACQFAAANTGVSATSPHANTFADSYPVYLQTCTRQGQAFSFNPLQVLTGYDTLTQTQMDTIMANGGCSNRNNLIYVCMLDSQFGKVFGGTSLVWAVVYGTTTGVINGTATPVSTIYVYVLN